jgi:arylsulfatase A-like enzyme
VDTLYKLNKLFEKATSMINRRKFLSKSMAVAASGVLSARMTAAERVTKQKSHRRPNLLFIMPDEFRMEALGIWQEPGFEHHLRTLSDPVHTPVLNNLAKESRLFTQACSTAAVCSPSRAMLMSGMYPSQNGVVTNCYEKRQDGMHDNIVCLTDVLADAGYDTAYVGKTHWEKNLPLFDAEGNYVGTESAPGGHYVNPYDTYIPPGKGRHSNRYWFADIRDKPFDALSYSSVPTLVDGKKDGQPYSSKEFTPVLEADVVIGYLKNKAGERDASKPFSMIWSPDPPHPPFSALKYCDQQVYDKYYKGVAIDKLLNRPNVNLKAAASNPLGDPTESAPVYFSLVTTIDEQVGRVLQALEESGEAENTIVVFTSDHGEMMGSHGLMGKSVIYDEAFLIPFLLRSPKQLKPGVEDLLLGRVDVMPTLLGMMGLGDRIPKTVRGVDYSSGLLTGRFPTSKKPNSAAYLMDNGRGVRSDHYTYLVTRNGQTELYDNIADPYQMKNLPLTAIAPAQLTFLQSELGRWLKTADDPWVIDNHYKELIVYPS